MARLLCGGSGASQSYAAALTGRDLSSSSSGASTSSCLRGCTATSRAAMRCSPVWIVENVSRTVCTAGSCLESRTPRRVGGAASRHQVWRSGHLVRPQFVLQHRPVLATVAVVETGMSSSSSSAIRPPFPEERVTLGHARTEEELLYAIRVESERQRIPPRSMAHIERFWNYYKSAVMSSGRERALEEAVRVMGQVFERIFMQFENPYIFDSHHLSIREPYDYYRFGQEYLRPLIDFENSYVGNCAILDEIESYIKQGHNVVLLSNHQTEADPGLMALLLEKSHPFLAENLTYVAGDRVVQDPFCKPFSMGRNLLCVYSKKHINDDPATAVMKTSANRRTLKVMASLFAQGGQLVWIAPSGGRDRPNEKGAWFPAPFDAASVETMRRLAEQDPGKLGKGKQKPPGHLYPLALLCYSIMPPPRKVEKELGEERVIGYHGIGMSVGSELNFKDIAIKAGLDVADRAAARELFSQAAYDATKLQYNALMEAVVGGQGCAASTPYSVLEQPFFGTRSSVGEDSLLPTTASLGDSEHAKL
ncbi:hypothetical protein CBR_g4494 [Chara braunii]|uniref:glycerol-3-phosphate 1-O-acyltransferase n=1 Tax=Chara braunii TaxID=69332 RepID=A0A388KHX2_CHABU|nr:hypothetical protein CBR_g4494 [Chara braunii]|eukprot:GBG69664.1 hypothetical protein CBR_g4494 [Chara braunii]